MQTEQQKQKRTNEKIQKQNLINSLKNPQTVDQQQPQNIILTVNSWTTTTTTTTTSIQYNKKPHFYKNQNKIFKIYLQKKYEDTNTNSYQKVNKV